MLDVEYMGLSTDTKPVNARDKSIFYETDTGNMYVYSIRSSAWIKL